MDSDGNYWCYIITLTFIIVVACVCADRSWKWNGCEDGERDRQKQKYLLFKVVPASICYPDVLAFFVCARICHSTQSSHLIARTQLIFYICIYILYWCLCSPKNNFELLLFSHSPRDLLMCASPTSYKCTFEQITIHCLLLLYILL